MTIFLGKTFKSASPEIGNDEFYKIISANAIEDTYSMLISKDIQGVVWYREETGKYSDLEIKFKSGNFEYVTQSIT